MIEPIIFYNTYVRDGEIPGNPEAIISPLIFPAKLIGQTPVGGIGLFDGEGKPVNSLEQAQSVVVPKGLAGPPGFRKLPDRYHGQPSTTEWQVRAESYAVAAYNPAPALPQYARVDRQSSSVTPKLALSPRELKEPEEKISLVETADGYAMISTKSRRQTIVTNFIVNTVTMVHQLKGDGSPEQNFVHLKVSVIGERLAFSEVDIAMNEIDSVGTQIIRKVPTAIIEPENRATFLSRFPVLVRKRIQKCQHHYVYLNSGWFFTPSGTWTFVHDGANPPTGNIKFQSGFRFGLSGNGHATRWLVQNAYRLLALSRDLPTILIPFLCAHLALMWTLFESAGYPPHVLLFIKGITGSLKTALASLLFNFSGDPKNNIPASFRDTSASMEVQMSKYKDRVLLVDDFCPAASENARRTLEQNLEQLVRFYGDGIAKARTTPRLTETYEKRPHGFCAITGEDSAGSYSSLLRCLFITVQPDTYDKNLLAEFQKNPTLWTEYLSHFVNWCVQNAETIISVVREQFPILRDKAGQAISERRLVDAYASFSLTASIVLNFVSPHLGLSDQEKDVLFHQYDNAILDTCRRSAEASKEANPVQIFARLICEGLDKKAVQLAVLSEYKAASDKFIGYDDGIYWHLRPRDTYAFIRHEYELGGKKFPLSESRLREALYISGALVPLASREESGDNFEYLFRESFGQRSRMMRIDSNVLKKFL